jgi:hypothetical protein
MHNLLLSIAACAVLCAHVGVAQIPDLHIQKVEVKDSLVIVTYQLTGKSEGQYDIEVYLVSPKNPTLRRKLGSLIGDVGKNVGPGDGKSFIWESRRDYPHPRAGEELQLELQAQESVGGGIPWYYYVGGGVAVTAAAILMIRPAPTEENRVTTPSVPLPPPRP